VIADIGSPLGGGIAKIANVVNFRLSPVWRDRAILSIALLAVANAKDRQLRPKSLCSEREHQRRAGLIMVLGVW
jgi:hypothetical protein